MCDETKLLANSRGSHHRSLFLLAPFNRFRMWKTRQSVWKREESERAKAEVSAGGGTEYISKPLGKIRRYGESGSDALPSRLTFVCVSFRRCSTPRPTAVTKVE